MEQENENKLVPQLFKLHPDQAEWLKKRKAETGNSATATVRTLIEQAMDAEKAKAS